MANRKSRKQRQRIKAAIAKVVARNLSEPMPERAPYIAQVKLSPAALRASTHLGVKTSLHEGAARTMIGDDDNVIAHRGYNLNRPEAGRMFGKVAPPKTFRTTAPKAKPFALKSGVSDAEHRARDKVAQAMLDARNARIVKSRGN